MPVPLPSDCTLHTPSRRQPGLHALASTRCLIPFKFTPTAPCVPLHPSTHVPRAASGPRTRTHTRTRTHSPTSTPTRTRTHTRTRTRTPTRTPTRTHTPHLQHAAQLRVQPQRIHLRGAQHVQRRRRRQRRLLRERRAAATAATGATPAREGRQVRTDMGGGVPGPRRAAASAGERGAPLQAGGAGRCMLCTVSWRAVRAATGITAMTPPIAALAPRHLSHPCPHSHEAATRVLLRTRDRTTHPPCMDVDKAATCGATSAAATCQASADGASGTQPSPPTVWAPAAAACPVMLPRPAAAHVHAG